MVEEELPERDPADHADSEFVRTLAPEFDAYVNDAYSAAHRAHASTVGFPLVLPAYAGRVMVAEYEANSAIASREFDGDVTMVVGGTKATDVIDVMEALGDRVDTFCTGGVAGELLLRAAGHPVGYDVGGTDLFDDQWAENSETVVALVEERADQLRLASDLAFEDDGERAEVAVDDIEDKTDSYLDVGRGTVESYAQVIDGSAAVFVKGALGVFEDERFSHGTVGVLEAIAGTDCFSVVGGGDTSRAIELYGLDEDDFSHVSIAGGAYIRALTGEPLVAVELLRTDRGDEDG
jgi:phosphoglycerate kinase